MSQTDVQTTTEKIDVGTGEGDYAVKDAGLLRDALVARGWTPEVDLKYLEAEGARHDELAWAERVGPVLKYLFPDSNGG